MLETQKRRNYKNEYDRLRGALLAGLVRESFLKYINERMGKFKDLARESIHGKKHKIFRPKEDYEKTDEEKAAEQPKKPRSQRPDAHGNENATRNLIKHISDLNSTLADLERSAK